MVADFISGAVEWLSPANEPDHWDVIEGQGSLFHPSFAGVSLGLLHGAQPDALVVCHEPTRTHMRGVPHQPLPGLRECLDLTVRCGTPDQPGASGPSASSVNTAALDDAEPRALPRGHRGRARPAGDRSGRYGVGAHRGPRSSLIPGG